MTLAEYYGFPKGTKCIRKYYNLIDDGADYPIDDMSYMFSREERQYLPNLIGLQPTTMNSMCDNCKKLTSTHGLQYLDTSKCTSMENTFYYSNIINFSYINNWNISNVTSMYSMFGSCTRMTDFDVNWDTSKVSSMERMFYSCSALKSICRLDCSSVEQNKYPLWNTTSVINIGGFINMKSSWSDNYGLSKCPNLTYESCINILNGLYDFTGHNETPSSTQGKLKVHANFLTTVGDEISIGTSRGWVITT